MSEGGDDFLTKPVEPRHLIATVRNRAARARNLKALILRRLGRAPEARALLDETLAIDPLDAWALHLAERHEPSDLQTSIDIALDFEP